MHHDHQQAATPAAHPALPPGATGDQETGASSQSSAAASAAAADGAPNQFNADWLSIPGAPMLDVPGVGPVPSKTVVAIGLLILAIAIMMLAILGVPARGPPARPAAKEERKPLDLGGGDKPDDENKPG